MQVMNTHGTPQSPTIQEWLALKQQVALLTREAETERREKEDYKQRFEELVDVQDIISRVTRNSKLSYAYKFLYLSLIETYPGLLEGVSMEINVCKVRENAGWVSKMSATNFFQDMQSIGAFTYHSGPYDGKENTREGYLVPNPDVFPYPETFDTKGTEKRRGAREKANKDRDEWKRAAAFIQQCEKCGSIDIKYDLYPVCQSCQHQHTPEKSIEGHRITIEPGEEHIDEWEEADEFTAPLDEEPAPIRKKRIRRPVACHCGIYSRWVEDAHGISHCTHCEIGVKQSEQI